MHNFFLIVCVELLEFWAFFEKLRNSYLQNYVNCLSHNVSWMCNFFRKNCVHWSCKRLSVFWKIAYFNLILIVYDVNFLTKSVCWMHKFFQKIVFIECAKFLAFVDRLRSLNEQSYVNSLSNSVRWMQKFLKLCVYVECVQFWVFFETLSTLNVQNYVDSFCNCVYVERAEFWALFEKLHNFHLEM